MSREMTPDEIAAQFGMPLRRALEAALGDAHEAMTAAGVDGPAQIAVLCTTLGYLVAEQIKRHAPQDHRFQIAARTLEITTTALLTGDTNPDRRHLQ